MKKSENQPEANQPKIKTCTKCNTEKPIEDFRTHKSGRTDKSGFVLNQCRECERKAAYDMIKAGELPCFEIGRRKQKRIKRGDLDKIGVRKE